MVLCQFYLNNNCRFGSKCANEHFDVKQLIKTEVEAAIKGTQWPLSCFGPFKEKSCLPNFINDQSFEEIRFLCYEAKKQNNLQAYAQQFSQEVMGAQNRMKALLSLSRDVVDAVVNLYNSQDPNVNQQEQKSNPFSLGGGGGFGQPQVNNGNANSVFGGGSATQANPFANAGFGGVAQSASSIFGGTNTPTVASNGLFGQQAGFGTANTFGAPNASIFGGGQHQQPQQQTQQLGAFALPQIGANQQTNQATSPFGMQPQVNAYGNQPGNAFTAQTAAPQTGLFSQQNNQMPPTGLFGQVGVPQQQQQMQPQNTGFGSPSVPQGTGLFGQPAIASGQSIFGGNAATTPQQQTPFGSQIQMQQTQQQQSQAQVGFGMQQSNVFASPQLQQQQQQHQMQQQQPPTATNPGSLFGGGGQANIFQQNVPQSIGAQNNMGQLIIANSNMSDTVYSRMEDLSPEVLEAFRAPEFILGKMPTVPPPRELC